MMKNQEPFKNGDAWKIVIGTAYNKFEVEILSL